MQLLLSLAAMGYRPPAPWVAAALTRLQQAFESDPAAAASPASPLRSIAAAAAALPSTAVDRAERTGASARLGTGRGEGLLPEAEAIESDDAVRQVAQLLEGVEGGEEATGGGGSGGAGEEGVPLGGGEEVGRYRVPQAAGAGWEGHGAEGGDVEGQRGLPSSAVGSSSGVRTGSGQAGSAGDSEGEEHAWDEGQGDWMGDEEDMEEEEVREDDNEEGRQEIEGSFDSDGEGSEATSIPQHLATEQRQRAAAAPGDLPSSSSAAAAAPLSARELAIVAWCLGALDFVPSQAWLLAFSRALAARLPSMGPDEVSDVVHGLAGIDAPVGPALQRLLPARAAEVMRGMGAQQLARVCSGMVRLGWRPGAGAAGQVAELLPGRQGVEAFREPPQRKQQQQGMGSMGGAPAATAGSGSGVNFTVEFEASLERLTPRLSTSQVADVLGYLAWAGHCPEASTMTAAVEAAAAGAAAAHPAALVGVLWSLARLSYKPPPEQLHVLLAVLQPRLNVLGRKELADVAWALCVLRHRPGARWLGQYMGELAARARYMAVRELTDALWALACFGAAPDGEWLRRVAGAVAIRLRDGEGHGGGEARDGSEGMGWRVKGGGGSAGKKAVAPGDAAVLVWALRELGYRGGEDGAGLLEGLEAVLVDAAGGPG